MKRFILALAATIALLAPKAAEAKAPVSAWCQDHKDGKHNDAVHKDAAANMACQICVYQADHDLPELGNTNNETCVYIRDAVVVGKLVKDGALVQCDPSTVGVAACELTRRCFEAGLTPGSGGIAFSTPKPLTPEEQAKVVVDHDVNLGEAAKRAVAARVTYRDDLAKGGLKIVPSPPVPPPPSSFCSSTGCKVAVGIGIGLAATGLVIGGLYAAGVIGGTETIPVHLGGASSALMTSGVSPAFGF